MLKKENLICLASIFLATALIICTFSSAGIKEDFFQSGLSAKSLALGGTAFGFGVDSIYSNPAGLAVIPDEYYAYAYKSSFENMVNTTTFQFMQPYQRGAWGLGLIYMDNSNADKTVVNEFDRPEVVGKFGETQTGLSAAYAFPIWGDSAVGLGVRYYHNKLDNEYGQGLGFFGGYIKKLSYDWLFGMSINNLSLSSRLTSMPIVWSTRQVDYFPLRISTSLAHRNYLFDYQTEYFLDHHLVQVNESGAMTSFYSLGSMIWLFPKVFSARGGWSEEILSLGCGLRLNEWGVDYAYLNHKYLGGSHYITVSYKIGGNEKVKPVTVVSKEELELERVNVVEQQVIENMRSRKATEAAVISVNINEQPVTPDLVNIVSEKVVITSNNIELPVTSDLVSANLNTLEVQ